MSTTTAPLVAIYVRHTPGCKYSADETARRCNCRKHLRWSQGGKQYRRKANSRSWAEAEQVKRDLEDQLSGRATEQLKVDSTAKLLDAAIEVFITDKTTQGLSDSVVGRYRLLLNRLRTFCDARSTYTVRGLTADVLTMFVSDWSTLLPLIHHPPEAS
jgi:hypothetical protein